MQKELSLKKLENLEKIDRFRGWHKYGCFRFHSSNYKHAKAIFDKCWDLFKLGHKFATEVILKNGRIVDLIDFTTGEFYEFETGKSYKKKGDVIVIQI